MAKKNDLMLYAYWLCRYFCEKMNNNNNEKFIQINNNNNVFLQ